MRRHLADYYACISSLDHHLGRVLDAVKATGQLDNTLVVFTSDQGLAVGGRHGLMGKQNLYEHVKPPLIVAGPGVPKGKSRRAGLPVRPVPDAVRLRRGARCRRRARGRAWSR